MGWFDSLFPSSTRIDVNTSVSRVVADDSLPNSVQTGTIKALFQSGNLSEYLAEEAVNSVGLRAERMYKYAERKYAFGMPSGEIYSTNQKENAVVDVLQRQSGGPITVEYSHFGPVNFLHFGWVELVKKYGYTSSTNQIPSLTAAKGVPVYLEDLVVVVPTSQLSRYSSAALDQYGVAPCGGYTPERPLQSGFLSKLATHSPIQTSDTATTVQVLLKYIWKTERTYTPVGTTTPVTESIVHRASEVLPITGFKEQADYFQVRYLSGVDAQFFAYEYGAGLYPPLDAAFNVPMNVMGEFFPFAYFRYDKAPMNADKGSAGYKTSKKLLSYLNMDYDSVIEAVHQNPGIADIQQAMMIMAVSANATDQDSCRYLFDFFNKMYYFLPVQYTYVDEFGLSTPLASPSVHGSSITIKDNLFEMALSNSGIVKERKMGVLGKIGTCASEVVSEPTEVEVFNPDTNSTEKHTIYRPAHLYKLQISDVAYDEIHVRDLQMKYFIWGGYTTLGDDKDAILLVPLDRSITQNYGTSVRERLYTQSMHFVFNALVRTEVKWYESSFFRDFLVIVSIIVTVYTLGSTWQSIAAAMALGATAATITMMIALELLIMVVTVAAFKIFVKEIGVENAFIIAIAAALYGGYQAYSAGSMAQSAWAENLLAISSNLSTGISNAVGDMMGDLMTEAQSFELYAEQQQEKLDKANDLLKQDVLLSPFVIFGESPSDFYQRTVHSGNIGVLGIESVSSYVDVALTLPKLSETLGGDLNG